MYLAFISVYLLTCFNYVKFYEDNLKVNTRPWHPIMDDTYKDMDDNLLPNLNYCGNKTCLVKCCGDRQYLDSNFICRDVEYFKEIYYKTPGLGEDSWKDVMKGINRKRKNLETKFALLQRVQNSIEPISNFSSLKFYLLDFGTLAYTYDPVLGPWIELTELKYCVDYLFNSRNDIIKVDFVFELVKEPQENIDRKLNIDKKNINLINIKIVGAGLVITFISAGWLLFRLRKIQRRYILYALIAYLYTITFAYGLKLMELFGTYTGVTAECKYKYISTAMYFLLLSAFCWPLAMTYDLLSSIRKFRMKKETANEVDIVTFFRFSAFAWGLPLVLTVLALALDKFHLGTWITEKLFFDRCFEDDTPIMLYLYAPIAMLILVNSLLFLIYSYDMSVIKCVLRNNSYLANAKFTALRSLVCKKLIGIVILMILLQYIPDVPALLSNTLYVSCTMMFSVLLFVFFYKKKVFMNLYNRITNNTGKFQQLENETEYGQGNGKIATISNNSLDRVNNTTYVNNTNLEKNIAMFYNIDLEKDKNLDEKINLNEIDAEKCEETPIINNNDVEK